MTAREILAIIPARGGSKGIPGKNLRFLAGRPLLVHTLEHVQEAKSVQRVVVSTDDAAIAEVALAHGAEAIDRPAELASDTASSESALLHVLQHVLREENYRPDLVVFLQCTSPIRRPHDIDEAIACLIREDADSLLSVVPFHGFFWQRDGEKVRAVNYDYKNRPRRQDRAPEYRENGSIYVFKPSILERQGCRLGGKIAFYEMDARSSVDIDTPTDLEYCEWLLSRRDEGEIR